MMSVFTRLASTSRLFRLEGLRLYSSCQISADNGSLLINNGKPYLDIFSLTYGGGEDVIRHKKNLFFPTTNSSFQLFVCGPCRGLFCVYSSWQYVSVLDPATRDKKFVTFLRWNDLWEANVNWVGFGFDSNANDFKVIRSITCDIPAGKEVACIEIFSLQSKQRREIPVLSEIRSVIPSRSSVPCIDGVCYWSAKNHVKMRVLSFDFADEVFDVITLPPCDYMNYNPDTEECLMGIVNGLPAAIRYNADYQDKSFEVWVKKGTWVKEMSIGPIADVIKPLCFWKKDGMILLDSDYQLILYDFVSKQVKLLKLIESEESMSNESIIQLLHMPEKEGSLPPIYPGVMVYSS